MLADVAIIGGTGIGDVLLRTAGQAVHIPTPAGQLAGRLVEHGTGAVLVVSRHSSGHKVPPHLVNYRALALGLKKSGVRFCFSTAAVGSLRREWPVGTRVAVSDFADLTSRNQTLYDRQVVHTDFSSPFSSMARTALIEAASTLGQKVQSQGVYICENGPRYETPHEIRLLGHLGDMVGMTAATEAILLREAGIEYGCLALVTNLAAGLEDLPLDHSDVVKEMKQEAEDVVRLLLAAVDIVRDQP